MEDATGLSQLAEVSLKLVDQGSMRAVDSDRPGATKIITKGKEEATGVGRMHWYC